MPIEEAPLPISNINNWITAILVAAFLTFGGFIATKIWDFEKENNDLRNALNINTVANTMESKQEHGELENINKTIEHIRSEQELNSQARVQFKALHDDLERRLVEQGARHDAQIEEIKRRLDNINKRGEIENTFPVPNQREGTYRPPGR